MTMSSAMIQEDVIHQIIDAMDILTADLEMMKKIVVMKHLHSCV